jgi:hypothetical protein
MSERNVRYGAAGGHGRRIVEVPIAKNDRVKGQAQGAGALTAAGGGVALHASRKLRQQAEYQSGRSSAEESMGSFRYGQVSTASGSDYHRTKADNASHEAAGSRHYHSSGHHAHLASELEGRSKVSRQAGKVAVPLGLAAIAAGSIPKRKTASKSLVVKAEWIPTNVLSGAKKLGSTFANAMKDSAGGLPKAPLGGGSRGQRAAQAVGGMAGKATSTPGRTMGTIGGAATVGALGGAALGPKQTKSASVSKWDASEATKLGGKGSAIRRAKIVAHTTGGPLGGKLTVHANGKDLKGQHFDMRNAGVDEVKRRAKSHPIPGFSPYKNTVRPGEGGWGSESVKVTSSHRGWAKAPGPYVAAGGIGGAAALAHAQPDKKETKAAAYTRDTQAPPSRQHDPSTRLVPHRQFDPEARRQRHIGEAMAGSTVVGAGAGVSAIRAQRKHLKGIREANYAQDAKHFKGVQRATAAGKKSHAVRPEPIARTIKPGAVGRAAVAAGALGTAEAIRRRANDPNSRIHDRWN